MDMPGGSFDGTNQRGQEGRFAAAVGADDLPVPRVALQSRKQRFGSGAWREQIVDCSRTDVPSGKRVALELAGCGIQVSAVLAAGMSPNLNGNSPTTSLLSVMNTLTRVHHRSFTIRPS